MKKSKNLNAFKCKIYTLYIPAHLQIHEHIQIEVTIIEQFHVNGFYFNYHSCLLSNHGLKRDYNVSDGVNLSLKTVDMVRLKYINIPGVIHWEYDDESEANLMNVCIVF